MSSCKNTPSPSPYSWQERASTGDARQMQAEVRSTRHCTLANTCAFTAQSFIAAPAYAGFLQQIYASERIAPFASTLPAQFDPPITTASKCVPSACLTMLVRALSATPRKLPQPSAIVIAHSLSSTRVAVAKKETVSAAAASYPVLPLTCAASPNERDFCCVSL